MNSDIIRTNVLRASRQFMSLSQSPLRFIAGTPPVNEFFKKQEITHIADNAFNLLENYSGHLSHIFSLHPNPTPKLINGTVDFIIKRILNLSTIKEGKKTKLVAMPSDSPLSEERIRFQILAIVTTLESSPGNRLTFLENASPLFSYDVPKEFIRRHMEDAKLQKLGMPADPQIKRENKWLKETHKKLEGNNFPEAETKKFIDQLIKLQDLESGIFCIVHTMINPLCTISLKIYAAKTFVKLWGEFKNRFLKTEDWEKRHESFQGTTFLLVKKGPLEILPIIEPILEEIFPRP